MQIREKLRCIPLSSVINDLKVYANKIVQTGLVVGAGGNLSMRDGNMMYISPSGFDLQEIEDHEWVRVNIETGEILDDLKPSSEILMHLECFRKRPDITAVLHAHPLFGRCIMYRSYHSESIPRFSSNDQKRILS